MSHRPPPASRRPVRVLAVLTALVILAACGGPEATPTLEPSRSPESTGAATAAPSLPSTLPDGIATVTAQVPAGTQSQRLLLVEGPVLLIQEPDGSRLELARFEPGGGTPGFPAWSPDGETIAFVRRTFFPSDPEVDFGDDVYLVPADGSAEARMVREHSAKAEQVYGLAWRPDSQRLLLGRIDLELRNGVPTQIAGTAIIELDTASNEERTVVEGGYDPSLSEDGERLAYLAVGELPTESTLMLADGDGANPAELARSAEFEIWRFPRISPDGRQIVVTAAERREASRRGGWLQAVARRALAPFLPTTAEAHGIPMDLWLIDAASGERTRLTAIGEDDPYPAWSADGETLAFIGTNGLYEVGVDGAGLVRIGDGRFDGQVAVAPR